MSDNDLHHCCGCDTDKAATEFYPSYLKRKVRKSGSRQGIWCKSCHKNYYKSRVQEDRTYFLKYQNRTRQKRFEMLKAIKEARGCERCGWKGSHAALDFHHRDPSQKHKSGAGFARLWGRSVKVVLEEVAKCDVLCANCHRILHYEEREAIKRVVADLTAPSGQES